MRDRAYWQGKLKAAQDELDMLRRLKSSYVQILNAKRPEGKDNFRYSSVGVRSEANRNWHRDHAMAKKKLRELEKLEARVKFAKQQLHRLAPTRLSKALED